MIWASAATATTGRGYFNWSSISCLSLWRCLSPAAPACLPACLPCPMNGEAPLQNEQHLKWAFTGARCRRRPTSPAVRQTSRDFLPGSGNMSRAANTNSWCAIQMCPFSVDNLNLSVYWMWNKLSIKLHSTLIYSSIYSWQKYWKNNQFELVNEHVL